MQSEGSKFPGFFGEFKRRLNLEDEKAAEHSLVEEKEKKEKKEKKGEKSEEHQEPEETMTALKIRQNFHVECESGLNKQLCLEIQAAYTYHSMATYFNREDVALHGFSKFFQKSADEERGHATMVVLYINKRGGTVIYEDIPKPSLHWGTGLQAMLSALDMEKAINQHLLDLHKMALDHFDPHLETFLEQLIDEQVDTIKKLGDFVTNLKKVGPGLGEHIFDKEILHDDKKTLHYERKPLHHDKKTLHD